MLKLRLTLFFACLNFIAYANSQVFKITEHPYRFSTYFEMRSDKYEGRVISNFCQLRTSYQLYDARGEFVAEGICRALSLGALFSWAREIDIYDEKGKTIGLIDGTAWTTAKAKFSLCNGSGETVAVAFLDYNCAGFLIARPGFNEETVIQLNREKTAGKCWSVTIYDPSAVDARLLKIFAAFVVDHQKSFSAA